MIYKKIILFFVILLLISLGIIYFLNNPPSQMKDEIIKIEKGDSLKSAAGKLKEKNLIKNDKFYILLALVEKKSVVLAGKYKIYGNMTTNEIIKRISSGDIIRRKITIPEGLNIFEIADLLEENEITGENEFLKYSHDPEFLASIGIKSNSAEGFLFPDTYILPEDQEPRDVIIILHNRFANMINSVDFSNIKKLKLNIDEIINLASLIEKETSIRTERGLISAVFYNRLSRKMTLGCDPTIRYAVKKFKGRLSKNDLKYNSPYNTYINKGLPPTPICSPGKESILAALNPVKVGYLYFVARNDGSHYFSKSLKEHNRAVEFYQKGIRNGFIDEQNN